MIASPLALVTALAALTGLALVRVDAATAGPVPDTVQIALMRLAIADVPLVRVRGDFVDRSGYKPRLDASGVRFDGVLEGAHGAMRSNLANAGQIEPIPWHQISSIETERAGTMGASVLVGGALGLAVGTAVALATTDFYTLEDQTHRGNTIIAVSTLSGLAVGALVGHHGKLRTIYPPAAHEDGR